MILKKISSGIEEVVFYQVKIKITFSESKSLTLFTNAIFPTFNSNKVAGKVLSRLPTGLSQSLNFSTLESTISNMDFECVNGILSNGQTLSEYLYERFYDKTNRLKDAKCEIYLQYNLIENYLLYTGYLDIFEPNDIYETSYTLKVNDITKQIKSSCLSEYFDIKYGVEENMPTGIYGTFQKIARKEENGNIGEITGIKNFKETTLQSVLDVWETVEDDWWYIIRYTGHPIDFAKELITITAGITAFDSASFNNVRDNSKNNGIIFDFELKEEISDTLSFVREQCFMPCYAFFYIGTNGKMYVSQIEQPTTAEALPYFNESNIISIEESTIGTDNIVNTASVKFDYNEETDDHISILYNVDDNIIRESIEMFGMLPEEYTIELAGLNRNAVIGAGKDVFSSVLTDYIFNRNSTSVKTLRIIAMFENAKGLKIGDFIQFSHTKIIDWKKQSPNRGNRGVNALFDIKYAVIDVSLWGDYTATYEDNTAFEDATAISGQDSYNGSLIWEYNWYIQSVQNKAVPVLVTRELTLPAIDTKLRNQVMIKIETFQDVLLNHYISENFLDFHNA